MTKLKRTKLVIIAILIMGVFTGACGSNEPAEPPTATYIPTFTVPAPPSSDETATPGSSTAVADLEAQLQGLSIDDFLEESFQALMMRDPEGVLLAGLNEDYGMQEAALTNISDAYVRETQRMESAVLEMLRGYDREPLSVEQQNSYDVYLWYLEDLVAGHEFMYYGFPVSHFDITSMPQSIAYFFSDSHPITTVQDAEDYITRLSLVDEKLAQLKESLEARKEAGVITPEFSLQGAISSVRGLANASPKFTPFYSGFAEKLSDLEGLSSNDEVALLASAEAAIIESVIPAYKDLAAYLESLRVLAPDAIGLGQFPKGEAYYAYILRHHTTTDMTPEEIHQLGLTELDRIHAEMRVIFDQLGYPQDESLEMLFNRVAADGGTIPGNQIAATYESIIEQADQNVGDYFDIRPSSGVEVIGGPAGNYYEPGPLDGSRPGKFYAFVNQGGAPYFRMPSIAYHEAIPGHHFQIAITQQLDLPTFRNIVFFNAYVEGWGLYAERLALEMGWYEGDPYGDLGRLNLEALRAARLVVDTGIHAQGWTHFQAVNFIMENLGDDRGTAEYRVGRYVAYPGQAASYMIGMLKILELRQSAMDQLGDQFDIKEFHNVVLTNGSLPLSILERVVDDYVQSKLASADTGTMTGVGLSVVMIGAGLLFWPSPLRRKTKSK